MEYIYLLLGIFLSILVSTFFSLSETAILSFDKNKLEFLIEKGDRKARLLKNIIDKPEKILSPILLGNTIANVTTASLTSILISRIFVKSILGITQEFAQVFATLLISILILIFGEITPKSIAARNPEKYAFSVAYILNFISRLLLPLVKVSIFFSSLIIKRFSREEISKGEIKREKILNLIYRFDPSKDETPLDMMKNVADFHAVKVKEIMIPISRVVAVDVNSSLDEILDVFIKSEYTRIPVYDGDIENIVGVILSKEFFKFYMAKKGIIPEFEKMSFESIINRPLFISEFSTVDSALKKIKNRKLHFAFVVGEFGQVIGIVTLEDILEEIVGEIYDEYDYSSLTPFERDGNKFVFHENINIKDFNKNLPAPIPESESYSTLFGYLTDKFEDVPIKGTVIEDENYIYKIRKSDKFGIKEVELEFKKKNV